MVRNLWKHGSSVSVGPSLAIMLKIFTCYTYCMAMLKIQTHHSKTHVLMLTNTVIWNSVVTTELL